MFVRYNKLQQTFDPKISEIVSLYMELSSTGGKLVAPVFTVEVLKTKDFLNLVLVRLLTLSLHLIVHCSNKYTLWLGY